METLEPISTAEASAALASAQRTQARVAWSGYPAWYWLTTGAGLAALSCTMLLPAWWDLAIPVALGVLLVAVARAASRARGVCEGWTHSAMTVRDRVVLYGPAPLVILANAVASKFVSWSPIVAAVLVFVAFAGTGLAMGARAARR
jgi:hypothetical protein